VHEVVARALRDLGVGRAHTLLDLLLDLARVRVRVRVSVRVLLLDLWPGLGFCV
jgi:hypothetical protein